MGLYPWVVMLCSKAARGPYLLLLFFVGSDFPVERLLLDVMSDLYTQLRIGFLGISCGIEFF